MTGKSVKDIDRYQAVLTSLLASEENKFCADCHAKGKAHISYRTILTTVSYFCSLKLSTVCSVFVFECFGLGPVFFFPLVWLVCVVVLFVSESFL